MTMHPTTVWTEGWPTWPQAGRGLAARLAAVAEGGRWAVSGNWTGQLPLDTKLAREFAAFVGAPHCIPVDHGSSALMISLLLAGLEPGEEVIVPGLTWVACASVVLRLGGVPVLVDIDPETLCIEPEAVEAAITPSTRAIIAVHLYSAMADMGRLRPIAEAHGVFLIEDCAQAYGSEWEGRGAGTIGDVGAYSAQQGKCLTAGEGGLFVTTDDDLAHRAELLRGDGRAYRSSPQHVGESALEEHSSTQGWNMHMSEFQSAILLDGLERLASQTTLRERAAATLDSALAVHGDLIPIRPYSANTRRGYYHYAVRLAPGAFGGLDAAQVSEALTLALGIRVYPPYVPLNRHILLNPEHFPLTRGSASVTSIRGARLEAAERASKSTVLLHHPMLLGTESHLDAIVRAFSEIREMTASSR